MFRLARVMVITVGIFVLAWVLKEILGDSDSKKADELVQKIRLSGI